MIVLQASERFERTSSLSANGKTPHNEGVEWGTHEKAPPTLCFGQHESRVDSPVSAAVHVRICRGRDCQSDRGHVERLTTSIDAYQAAEQIKCQDICKGPVVVMRKGQNKCWLRRNSSPQTGAERPTSF